MADNSARLIAFETGESVTSTTPYSLYVTTDPTKAIAITVKEDEDGFILCYDRGGKNLRLYINENGIGITASEDPAMVRFYWDAQNQALYQMEGGIKYYLAFKTLNNELRLTSVAETEALTGNSVHLMKLHGDSSASTGDNALLTLMGTLLAVPSRSFYKAPHPSFRPGRKRRYFLEDNRYA